MESKRNTTEKESPFQVETIRTKPEDGIVPEGVMHPSSVTRQHYGKYHVGYSSTKTITISDPRVTKYFFNIFCAVFFGIGLLLLVLKSYFFGIIFMAVGISAYFIERKKLNRNIEKQKEQSIPTRISEEEKEAFKEDLKNLATNQFKESARETFSESQIKGFTKISLPLYSIIGIITTLLLSFAVGIVMGIFVAIMFIGIGIFYYLVFLKLIGKLFSKNKEKS